MKKEEILTLLEEETLQDEQEFWKSLRKMGKTINISKIIGKIIQIGRTSGMQ